MTFETPEGKSITWSNIKKNQKAIISDSYVHNCPNSLCMISKLEFVFRNVPSGLRNSVSLLSSQYPRRPEVLPAMTIYLSTLNIGYLLRFFSPVHLRSWVCDVVSFICNLTVTERIAIGQFRGPSFSYFFKITLLNPFFLQIVCLNLMKAN